MSRIVVLGEALIDLFAESGATLRTAAAFRPSPGGAPANVAVAIAKLGGDVGFIGKVGDDEFGYWLIDEMSAYGVDSTYIEVDDRAPTMTAIVALPEPDHPQFILYNGANEYLTPEALPTSYIESSSVFIYGSVTLSTNSDQAAFSAAKLAYDHGKHTLFDVNLRPNLWTDLSVAKQKIEAALRISTVVKANEYEVKFLTGENEFEKGSIKLLEYGCELCCISLGKNGAYFRTKKSGGYVSAFEVNSIDATGSGDAFLAGLALQISKLDTRLTELHIDELYNIIRFANACGALTTVQLGGMMGAPKLEAVQDLMKMGKVI